MRQKLPFTLNERIIAVTGNKQLHRQSESQVRPDALNIQKMWLHQMRGLRKT
jgi:hypothetical protein